ncbi:pectinesterase inhibitor-like [Sesamum indicum]|uniref:Pectinesterase inhibitor-like n=1 Tax=Sesamum indicum TaxID=4182 RepID=A0A6I9U2Y9_SESIN|nr:pectinesterase inhibitor-like [Sesamum indicum]
MELPFALLKPCILFFFILGNITFLRVRAKTSNDLISDVCKRTTTPRLCLQILKSNGRARKASSPLELGEVSMDLSKSSAKATKNMILFSSLRTRDKGLKERYKSCAVNYDSALYYINIANQYFKGGDYASVGRYTAAALNEPIACRHNFARAEPAWLREGNDKLECLCSVVLVISDHLSGRHCSFPAG